MLAVITTLAGLIAFTLLDQIQYQTINISNATTIEAPKGNEVSWTVDTLGIKKYTCNIKHTSIISFNSEEDLSLEGATTYALERDTMLNGASSVENYHGYEIKENTWNNVKYYIVSIANNETHDNIVISSESLDVVHHMIDSLKFGASSNDPKDVVVIEKNVNTTNNNKSTSSNPDDQVVYRSADGKVVTQGDVDRYGIDAFTGTDVNFDEQGSPGTFVETSTS